MRVYLFVNNQNIVYGYHTIRTSPEDIEFTVDNETWFKDNIGKLKIINNELVSVIDKDHTDLRALRRKECFPIINRGNLWYQSLTEAQVLELQTWYQAWLDATDTLVIPEKPSWLE